MTCLPLAISDRHSILTFCDGNGEASTLSNTGNTHVSAVALDELIHNQSVDFFKLDIEGAELLALKGAFKIISQYHSKYTEM